MHTAPSKISQRSGARVRSTLTPQTCSVIFCPNPQGHYKDTRANFKRYSSPLCLPNFFSSKRRLRACVCVCVVLGNALVLSYAYNGLRKVCQPCWQIAANFGGACPWCGRSPDAESAKLTGVAAAVRYAYTRPRCTRRLPSISLPP